MDTNDSFVELSKLYNRKKSDQDIFQELMAFKVTEVLLVATYYDAYSIVREGRFFDKIMGEYLQLNLFSAPRVTSVTSNEEALELLENRRFDMVILMAGLDKNNPLLISSEIKKTQPSLPVLLMVNNNQDVKYFDEASGPSGTIDRVFVWNGDSRVFLAMIKYVEDRANLENDVNVGDVRIILLVEDSQIYYTRYLPLLYSIVMMQTQNILSEESGDRIHKIMKMRVRPKIILASTYEEAVDIVDKYTDNLICLITDVKYPRNGIPDENAGIDLIKYVRSKTNMPVLMQSSEPENAHRATEVEAAFLDKNSDNLSFEIQNFINQKLGFGDFIFKNSRGLQVARARNLKEFEDCLRQVPPESLLYHARRNGISTWLMARGEISMAKKLRPYSIDDFESSAKLRSTILDIFEQARLERLKGRVVPFDPTMVHNNRFVMRIGEGSLGGKGRGLAFLSNFIENIDFEALIPDLEIHVPPTCIIGAGEFTRFLEKNNLEPVIYSIKDEDEIKQFFINAEIPEDITALLRSYLENMQNPLAVRSSGLFEDSLLQPFSGVYSTFMLPNNHPDFEIRLNELCLAIKLVYASIFNASARAYFELTNYKIEEEKMAVVIQEVVGRRVHNKYYPHASGIAQSYNYYPYSYMKPDDGFAVMGVGLGRHIVGGEKAWRFCPRYPNLELSSLRDQIRESQTHFYAINLKSGQTDLVTLGELSSIIRLSINEAEEDGNLKHCASVYDPNYDALVSNLSIKGPRIINFANILKYERVPLARTLDLLLRYLKEAMGAPVEIEYALDLEGYSNGLPILYLLQIKPLTRIAQHEDVDFNTIDQSKILLEAGHGMGNGRITNIYDVVLVDIENFDRTKTNAMAAEVDQINKKLAEEKREYVLMGPGRWGTRDPSTGIPVYWSQISHAKVIVEMGLPEFPLEASLGSHFFHNVTTMNVGYFSVHMGSANNHINLEILNKQTIINQTNHIRHFRFEKPLTILMDGKQQKAMIQWNE